ncbi:MAG: winged helix-turn-helix transcriptional regulator [Methanobacteriota archaeon]
MRKMVLKSASRTRVLDALRTSPGLTVGALSTRLGWDYKTVQYHVRVLARAGLLRTIRSGNRTLLIARGSPGERRERVEILVERAGPRVKKILSLLLAEPGLFQATVARRTKSTVSTTHFHVERLIRWGVVKARIRPGRRGKRLSISPKYRKLVLRAVAR